MCEAACLQGMAARAPAVQLPCARPEGSAWGGMWMYGAAGIALTCLDVCMATGAAARGMGGDAACTSRTGRLAHGRRYVV